MDRLQAMQVFARVVNSNSFSRAAESLHMSPPKVTRIIQDLEDFLGVRLIQRTTRRFNLTPDGAAYHQSCVRILTDIAQTETALTATRGVPRGRLCVEMPGSIGRLIIVPSLDDFHARYPQIELTIGIGDREVDLIREGIDCVIRVGILPDSSLVARRVGILHEVTAASPAYLDRHGTPRTIEELDGHTAVNCVAGLTTPAADMKFMVEGKPVTVKMKGKIVANDADAHLGCGVCGLGIVQVPRFLALHYLMSGELVEVLSQWRPVANPAFVVYPNNRHLPAQVRAFVDWTAEVFSQSPLLANKADGSMPDVSIAVGTSLLSMEHVFPERPLDEIGD